VVTNNYEDAYQFWFFVFFIHRFDVDFVVSMYSLTIDVFVVKLTKYEILKTFMKYICVCVCGY